MDKPTLRDVQLIELCIAKEIKRICTKHNICYFMSDGTLLGAVRHKGFIPWDDDMDFGMPLEDYKKFLCVAKEELSEDFFLQHVTTDASYILPYAKVRMNGTAVKETVAVDSKMHCGIWVDIFPYVTIEEKQAFSASFFWKANLLMTMYLMKNGYALNAVTRNPLKKIAKNILKYMPVKKKFLQRYIFGLLRDGSETSDYCMKIRAVLGEQFVFRRQWFDYCTEIHFEDDIFPAPVCYDQILTKEYGEYMVIPKRAERKTHSTVSVCIDESVMKKLREY